MAGMSKTEAQELLKNYAKNNPNGSIQELSTDGAPVGEKQSPQDALKDYTGGGAEPKTQANKDEKKAEQQAKAEEKKQNAEQAKQEKAQKEAQERQRQILEATQNAVQPAIDNLTDGVNNTLDYIGSRPTPGGVGALLLILIFFLWVIIPTSDGYTRAYLLWMTLTGRTILKDGKQIQKPDASGSAAFSPSASYTPPAVPGNTAGAASPLVPLDDIDSPFSSSGGAFL